MLLVMLMTKTYLWYSNGTCVTGRALASELGIEHYGSRFPPEDADIVVCWGARIPRKLKRSSRARLQTMVMLNNVNNIERNTDKFGALADMYEGGVNVPQFCIEGNITRELDYGSMQYPIVGRPKRHQGGAGFNMCYNESDMLRQRSHHYLQYIPNDEEYRFHIFDGVVMRVSKKVTNNPEASSVTRSRSKDWKMHHLSLSGRHWPSNAEEEAKKAVAAMGLDFGGVDIIIGEDGTAYVLEVNTGCGLDPTGLRKYAEKIQNKITTMLADVSVE